MKTVSKINTKSKREFAEWMRDEKFSLLFKVINAKISEQDKIPHPINVSERFCFDMDLLIVRLERFGKVLSWLELMLVLEEGEDGVEELRGCWLDVCSCRVNMDSAGNLLFLYTWGVWDGLRDTWALDDCGCCFDLEDGLISQVEMIVLQ